MSSPVISIVIPTYNRRTILEKCLKALFQQTGPVPDFEIIVVDNGSNDGTPDFIAHIAEHAPVETRYLCQPNRGPAAARNLGIINARGWLILFLGDDIIATSDLVHKHLRYHVDYPGESLAVLGFVTWSHEIPITPFMRWLEQGEGAQFAYEIVACYADNVPYKYLNTANVSIPRQVLLDVGLFDEDFPSAAQEDVELGFRLSQHGTRIVYAPSAIGYHLHPTTPAQACQRSIDIGMATAILCCKLRQPVEVSDSPLKRALRRMAYTELNLNILKWLASIIPSETVWRLALEAHVRAGFHVGRTQIFGPTQSGAVEGVPQCHRA